MANLPFSPRLALRVWQRELTLYSRVYRTNILATVLDPVVYLLAMGFGLGAFIETIQGRPYIVFIAPGLVASSVMMAATFESAWNSYVRMFTTRTYEAMMTTPATVEDVVVGELAWAATRATIYAVIMLGVLAALGLLRSWWALAIPLVAIPGGVMFAGIGLSYTAGIRYIDSLSPYFTLFITPMFLFSGIFFPLTRLPMWAQLIAQATPLFHLVRVMRGLAFGEFEGVLLSLVVVLVLALVAGAVAVARVRRRLVT